MNLFACIDHMKWSHFNNISTGTAFTNQSKDLRTTWMRKKSVDKFVENILLNEFEFFLFSVFHFHLMIHKISAAWISSNSRTSICIYSSILKRCLLSWFFLFRIILNLKYWEIKYWKRCKILRSQPRIPHQLSIFWEKISLNLKLWNIEEALTI